MKRRVPLYAQVLLGVGAGTLLGSLFGTRPYLFGAGNEQLGQLGLLVIRLLKALAAPLILFAILDAFVKTRLSARAGAKLVLICLVNVSVAFAIGLTILNVFQPGLAWRGHLPSAGDEGVPKVPGGASLDLLKNIAGYVPESLVEPFLRNNVITIVLAGVLGGAALRRVRDRQEAEGRGSAAVLAAVVEAVYELLVVMLEWVVRVIPLAVLLVVAQVVGRSGLGVFRQLWVFLATILAGFVLHGLVYYTLVAWLVGRKSPRVYLGKGADAIATGLSLNSSLATVPVTLRCLSSMGVSPAAARLSACVGTQLNNDGITLYEAMAALFIAQAYGFPLTLGEQVPVVLASLMAGAGIAGVPEAGLIVLPLVLAAAGLPETVVAAAIPLIFPVDWILARCRSGVNVMSDMLVAILLDRGGKLEE